MDAQRKLALGTIGTGLATQGGGTNDVESSVPSEKINRSTWAICWWLKARDCSPLANRGHAANKGPGVFVSDRVREAVLGIYGFVEAGTVAGEKGTESVWRLDNTVRQTA